MTNYTRVGNRTFTQHEFQSMSPGQIEQIRADGELVNQKRLDNLRKSFGIQPNAPITLNVTPAGVAARKIAIAAEEAKIAAETKAIADEIGPEMTTFVAEAEAPAEIKIKKSKGKKVA